MQLQQIAVLQYFTIQGMIVQVKGNFKLLIRPLKFLSPLLFRASPSEFIIPLAKYLKAVYYTRVSVGMRFRMLFETEESSVRR
jgi:hypothetical protein